MAAIFERQWLHAVVLAAMLAGLYGISRGCGCLHRGAVWGVGTWTWFWIAIAVPVAHQVYVWFCWRTELHRGLISRTLGRFSFSIYAVVFAAFMVARVVSVTMLAVASHNSLPVNQRVLHFLAFVVAVPFAYLGYSVVRYFTFSRAFGADHFDMSFRTTPLVREGIFRFTSNGMYIFGMLVLYIPALWFASRPALMAAVFGHVYIWVHYVTTEVPDMRRIYSPAA